LDIKIDFRAIEAPQLDVDMGTIIEAIVCAPKLKISREILRGALPNVVINGIPSVERAVINEVEGKQGKFELLAERYGLQDVMNMDGIIGTDTTSTHVIEVEKVLE
jgi:DNA-directed RNA polymerase III subunit RPC1